MAPSSLHSPGFYGCPRHVIVLVLLLAPLMSACASSHRRDPSTLTAETRKGTTCRKEVTNLSEPSVLVVQGDAGGGGYRAATEFLTGCSLECFEGDGQFPCKSRPHLHPPASWPAHHGHRDFKKVKNYRPYYVDAAIVDDDGAPLGKDLDTEEGLESATLVFYAGHGKSRSWEAHKGKTVELSRVSLGDGDARYLWMLSCHVMAHGPRTPALVGGTPIEDYLAPHQFDPRLAASGDACDSREHANVFCRWGRPYGRHGKPPLGEGMRLACGGSTELGGHAFASASIWQYKLVAGLDVADSFLLGLSVGLRIPLCLTRGRDDPRSTPLFDREFSQVRPTGDRSFLYIEYPVRHTLPLDFLHSATPWLLSSDSSPGPAVVEPPELYPILRVEPMPIPSGFEIAEPSDLETLEFGAQRLEIRENLRERLQDVLGLFGDAGLELEARRFASSGAILITATSSDALTTANRALFASPDEAAPNPPNLAQLVGEGLSLLTVPVIPEHMAAISPRVRLAWAADVRAMVIDRALAAQATYMGAASEDYGDRYLKCIYLRLPGKVDSTDGRNSASLLGEGADVVLLQLCPRHIPPELPSLSGRKSIGTGEARLVYLQRKLVEDQPWPVRRRAVAEAEAWQQLEKTSRKAYRRAPGASRWGYRAAPLHCGQQRMFLVYEFDFVPKDRERYEHYPVRTIEVPAHEGIGAVHEDWLCDPRAEQ